MGLPSHVLTEVLILMKKELIRLRRLGQQTAYMTCKRKNKDLGIRIRYSKLSNCWLYPSLRMVRQT